MKGAFLLRQLLKPAATADKVTRTQQSCYGSITATEEESNRSKKNNFSNNNKGKWVTLPPYTSTINAVSLGKRITGRSATKEEVNDDLVETNPITALKWVLRCCPQLSRSLVQKLFRLRQVRRECSEVVLGVGAEAEECQLKRVGAKHLMNEGDRIFLPITVKGSPIKKQEYECSQEEMNFIRDLELYKDEAVIAINKPPKLPVQVIGRAGMES